MLRRIFGLKRNKVTGGWRKLRNEELHNLYSSPSIIRMIKSRRMRWAGYVARMGEKRNPYRILVGKPEGKRPLGRPRLRWVDNIKIDLIFKHPVAFIYSSYQNIQSLMQLEIFLFVYSTTTCFGHIGPS
jgi:hypothetical protein